MFLQLVKHVEVKEINQSSVTSSFTLDEYLNYDAVCWARRYMEGNWFNHAIKVSESFHRPGTALEIEDKILDELDFCLYIICLVQQIDFKNI